MSFCQLWRLQATARSRAWKNKPELVQELLIKVELRLELELKLELGQELELELELIASDCKAFAHSDGGLCRF